MELILAFLAGAILAGGIAAIICRNIQKSKDAACTAALEAEKKRLEDSLADKEKAHQQTIDILQGKFDEAIKGLDEKIKNETTQLLKTRQDELSKNNKESLGQIVDPLKEQLESLQKKIAENEKSQSERNGELREHLRHLMTESENTRKSADELANALRHGTKVQGDWGETVLEELLSSQGLTEGRHFDVQATICDECGKPVKNAAGGIMRPDLILHLDQTREVIIDSKVSLTAYVDYINAEDEASREKYLKMHIESLRKHFKELAEKDYSSYIAPPKQSAGYVIMFVPNTGALWTALNADPKLWRDAADKNVYIADEQSLYGALRLIRLSWTNIAQAANQREVYKLAEQMVARVNQFREHYRKMGEALDKAREEYNSSQAKLEDGGMSILTTAANIRKLSEKENKKLQQQDQD
jgi:DNA recombination protein RmuC